MRRTTILALMLCVSVLTFGQSEAPAASSDASSDTATAAPASPAASTDATVPTATASPEASPAASAESAASADAAAPDSSKDASLAEIEKLSAKLEEANATIDQLRAQAFDLKTKADDDAEQKAAEAEALKAKVAELESVRDALYGKLASFGNLRLDPANFSELLRSGFDGSKARLGTWKLADGVLSQTSKDQYFSRLTFPLVQSSKSILYSFETRTSAKGWVGTGIHLFADDVKKQKGFGEGKSLLVWLTRDAQSRGNDGSYLQVYRSDSDVKMERVLDAKIKEKLDGWNRVEVLYEPENEFIVIAVNGSVRAAYRTYFGIGAGASISLRTLGAGVQFRNLEVRR